MKGSKIWKFLTSLTCVLFKEKIKRFPSFFALFEKIFPLLSLSYVAGGRRKITKKFWELQKTIVEGLKAKTTYENEFCSLRDEFCAKTSIFDHFLGNERLLGRSWATGGRRTHEKFWRVPPCKPFYSLSFLKWKLKLCC